MKVDELAAVLDPARTALLFGAGASIPSGGPSGADIVKRLCRRLSPDLLGADLSEVAQIFEDKHGRVDLVAEIRALTEHLEPTSGLLLLPQFPWFEIYTTNYDTLVEQAYASSNVNLNIHRSNFDSTKRFSQATSLYKIHGCVTQDITDGHRSRMIITENDYDELEPYRQSLFNTLRSTMHNLDTVIVGQSLADRHLKDLAKRVAGLREEGVQGRVFLMVHSYSQDRASIYENWGIRVVHGALDDLLKELLKRGLGTASANYSTESKLASYLTNTLIVKTVDVAHNSSLQPNATRLYHGSPASYADVRSGYTIERSAQARLEKATAGTKGFFLVVEGARGVGKTTLARTFMLKRVEQGIQAWEHQADDSLDVSEWLKVEHQLRLQQQEGFLFVDDYPRHSAQISSLVEKLGALDRPFLRVITTADSAKWHASRKSGYFFSRGTVLKLSLLDRTDLERLIELVETRPAVKALVETSFLALGRHDRIDRLIDRCNADMFVCLKNIFANENLDNILLNEFSTLSPEAQDVYRYVAAVQALGGYTHRQLVIRILNVQATAVSALLGQLQDIVLERDVDYWRGIYGWQTRHDVIASVIAKWKFSDQDELYYLLSNLIEYLNPAVAIEMETAVALAASENGIARLVDTDKQLTLYNCLIRTIPGHWTPRRRLIKLYLNLDRLPEADQEVARFHKDLGADPVVSRYSALIARQKAATMLDLEDGDRKAMLLHGVEILKKSLLRFGHDLYGYKTLGILGLDLRDKYGDSDALTASVSGLKEFERINADPDIQSERRFFEGRLAEGSRQAADELISSALADADAESLQPIAATGAEQ